MNVWFTMNGLSANNDTHVYVGRTCNNRVSMALLLLAVISIVACCYSLNLCALALGLFDRNTGSKAVNLTITSKYKRQYFP